jgi:hypothetical protein
MIGIWRASTKVLCDGQNVGARGKRCEISQEEKMVNTAKQLREIIDAARPKLVSIPERQASDKPYPEKWSTKEILGHLIDSAANNHQRIVRMQEVADIGTLRYTQLHWVKSQHYQSEEWADIVEFWYRYNAHLAHIIAHINPASLDSVCDMGYSGPAKLKFVVEDYVRHVQHHVDQIFSDVDARERVKSVTRNPGKSL